MTTVTAEVNAKHWYYLANAKKRIILEYGGAGSGKSYAIADHLVLNKLCKEDDVRIAVIRKTQPSLRITAWQLVLDELARFRIPYEKNKTEMTIIYGNNMMLFKGLDDPEKVKSLEVNYVWIEETNEISERDFLQLTLRLRRNNKNGNNQMFLSFNPVSMQSWLYNFTMRPHKDVEVLHSTYRDNRFLTPQYIEQLESLKEQDPTYHKIYALGEWATLENLIYTNHTIIPASQFPKTFPDSFCGLDFGYNNPTALLRIGIKDNERYERGLLYETHLTNEDLIEQLKILIPNRNEEIYADSAEPQRIEEIARAGFNIYPAPKGKGSVKHSIDVVKRQHYTIADDDVVNIAERETYKWKEDRDGNVLEEPVKFRDHYRDAERYAEAGRAAGFPQPDTVSVDVFDTMKAYGDGIVDLG